MPLHEAVAAANDLPAQYNSLIGFDYEENLFHGKANKKIQIKTEVANKQIKKEWAALLHSTQIQRETKTYFQGEPKLLAKKH